MSTTPTEDSSPSPTLHIQPLRRNRNYLLLWSGQTISDLGSTISNLAFPLLVLALTGSPLQAGIAMSLEIIPFLLFSLPAGVLADRWDRRRVMIFCDVGRALTLASIPVALFLGHLTIIQLYCTSFIEGTLALLFDVSALSSLTLITSKQQLPSALATSNASSHTIAIVGNPVSTFLFLTGRGIPFLFDAISYVVSVCTLLLMRGTFQETIHTSQRSLTSIPGEIREGFHFLWNNPFLRYQALLGGGLSLASGPELLIIILLVHQQHASLPTIGYILTAGSIGGILGSLVVSYRKHQLTFAQVMIGTFWIRTALWACYAIAPNPLTLGIIYFGRWLSGTISGGYNISYRLALVPDAIRGRVNSVHRLFGDGIGAPLGVIGGGFLLQTIGVLPTILIFAGWYAMLSLSMTVNRHVRNMPTLENL